MVIAYCIEIHLSQAMSSKLFSKCAKSIGVYLVFRLGWSLEVNQTKGLCSDFESAEIL